MHIHVLMIARTRRLQNVAHTQTSDVMMAQGRRTMCPKRRQLLPSIFPLHEKPRTHLLSQMKWPSSTNMKS